MRIIIAVILMLAAFSSCDRKPFVEHKVKLEKKADNCQSMQPSLHFNSNFAGERFEFEKCLPANFDKSGVISERHGDTVVVRFQISSAGPQPALYQVTLDIDSYPRYHFLTIDEETFTIASSDK